ncbi:aminotransferase class I/II-fold pyridoxal phosphate-dependent enzyme [Actinophytocola oryzae]|uniref:1-aminocyclopropane-1-carboxylate synthase n=1 Tax=Actinophytocola oryzae TaxID=502181 RepID=A0A4R7UY62_9PSEU|nr:aminotransferase class I/II-fold pyridoxal phosphate-dependent enzyme [Actinophytocola oryzae]TDV41104.1 1-aminocyclopropane-1-carboxylate synthase [Actinophytocola oryzae]
MTSRAAKLLAADVPAIAAAHFEAEADPYGPGNPGGYVNLGTADNRLVWDLLAPRLSVPPRQADVHYGLLYGTPELRSAVATLLAPVWPGVDAEDLVVVSGATAALDIVATTLCDPGDVILVPAPYYAAFDTDLTARSGARLLPVYLSPDDGFALDPVAIDRALTEARREGVPVRAIAVTSPSNPIGHVHSPTVLRDVVRVATAHSVDVIADEIYANSTFGAEFTSMVGERNVHAIWGLAKDFGLSGLKVGVLHTRDPEVLAAARALAYFAPVSTHTQALVTHLLSDGDWVEGFLTESRRRLHASATATMALLDDAGIGYVRADGGFSLWTDLRPHLGGTDEHTLWQRILREGRVNILPGSVFAAPEPGWFRLCHATGADTVATGIDRLAGVLS